MTSQKVDKAGSVVGVGIFAIVLAVLMLALTTVTSSFLLFDSILISV